VSYLASPAADAINGQVFVVYGPMVALMAAPVVERRFDADGTAWSPESLSVVIGDYFADRDPAAMFSASAALRELG
jgi:3-oxoacyl-[acyl-carrier protein] reductase